MVACIRMATAFWMMALLSSAALYASVASHNQVVAAAGPILLAIGHSLGGYTVLGLAGGWPSWKLPGIQSADDR